MAGVEALSDRYELAPTGVPTLLLESDGCCRAGNGAMTGLNGIGIDADCGELLSWPGPKFPDGGELAPTGVDVPFEPEPINADNAEKNLTGRAGDEFALLSATLSLLLVASAGANGPMKESWAWCAKTEKLIKLLTLFGRTMRK